jgi:hypothetical protein
MRRLLPVLSSWLSAVVGQSQTSLGCTFQLARVCIVRQDLVHLLLDLESGIDRLGHEKVTRRSLSEEG